jgi:hypothetical protein
MKLADMPSGLGGGGHRKKIVARSSSEYRTGSGFKPNCSMEVRPLLLQLAQFRLMSYSELPTSPDRRSGKWVSFFRGTRFPANASGAARSPHLIKIIYLKVLNS